MTEYVTPAGKNPAIELEFSSISADSSILVNVKQDEKITDKQAYVQAALLYTNPYGDRVIRIINFAFNVTNQVRIQSSHSFIENVFYVLLNL